MNNENDLAVVETQGGVPETHAAAVAVLNGSTWELAELDWSRARMWVDALAGAGLLFVLVSDEDAYSIAFEKNDFLSAIEEGRITLSVTDG